MNYYSTLEISNNGVPCTLFICNDGFYNWFLIKGTNVLKVTEDDYLESVHDVNEITEIRDMESIKDNVINTLEDFEEMFTVVDEDYL